MRGYSNFLRSRQIHTPQLTLLKEGSSFLSPVLQLDYNLNLVLVLKYTVILFTSVLLFLTHYSDITEMISSYQGQTDRADIAAEAPKINISAEELNKQFSPIAESYNLSEPIIFYFVVNETGKIQNPSLSESYDYEVSQEIIDLIKSAGVKPGTVSGKPTSNGIGLMLNPHNS